MAAKPRVHEIASEYGVNSKVLLQELKLMGEYVKGPSSSIEVSVARRLRAWVESNGWAARRIRGHLDQPESLEAAALVVRSPRSLPALVDLVGREWARLSPEAYQLLEGALLYRHFYYLAPGAAEETVDEELALPSPAGVALVGRRAALDDASWPSSAYLLLWSTAAGGELEVAVCDLRVTQPQRGEPRRAILGPLGRASARSIDGRIVGRAAPDGQPLVVLTELCASLPDVDADDEAEATPAHGPNSGRAPAATDPSSDPVRLVYVAARRRPVGGASAEPHERISQWRVRGHWRRQWYPSTQEHRRLWISEHTAGPAGSPIVRRELVYVIA
ncbi:translation initiation factor IF-2 N-terminal domain-containing protein [Agromyces bauzanensis]